jgi:hypothetical protein
MKQFVLSILCLALLGTIPSSEGADKAAGGQKKVIGYYMDAADDYY